MRYWHPFTSEAIEQLTTLHGKPPTAPELARYLELSLDEILDGLYAGQAYATKSLDASPEPLEYEAERRLARGDTGILDTLGRQFERALISKALARTGGRRIEAANLLGMGRNTITRKIAELGIEDDAVKPETNSGPGS